MVRRRAEPGLRPAHAKRSHARGDERGGLHDPEFWLLRELFVYVRLP